MWRIPLWCWVSISIESVQFIISYFYEHSHKSYLLIIDCNIDSPLFRMIHELVGLHRFHISVFRMKKKTQMKYMYCIYTPVKQDAELLTIKPFYILNIYDLSSICDIHCYVWAIHTAHKIRWYENINRKQTEENYSEYLCVLVRWCEFVFACFLCVFFFFLSKLNTYQSCCYLKESHFFSVCIVSVNLNNFVE